MKVFVLLFSFCCVESEKKIIEKIGDAVVVEVKTKSKSQQYGFDTDAADECLRRKTGDYIKMVDFGTLYCDRAVLLLLLLLLQCLL